jgi:hypothetical protein
VFELRGLVAGDLLLPALDTMVDGSGEGPVLDGPLQLLDDSTTR